MKTPQPNVLSQIYPTCFVLQTKDIMQIFGVSRTTAIKYMKKIKMKSKVAEDFEGIPRKKFLKFFSIDESEILEIAEEAGGGDYYKQFEYQTTITGWNQVYRNRNEGGKYVWKKT